MDYRRIKKGILTIIFALPLTISFSIISHEFGHVLTARLFGINNMAIYVWPGYEIYPTFTKRLSENWPSEVLAFSFIEQDSEFSETKPLASLYAPQKEYLLNAQGALQQSHEWLNSQVKHSVSQFQFNDFEQPEQGTIQQNIWANDDIKWPTLKRKHDGGRLDNIGPFQPGIIGFMGSGFNFILAMLALLLLYLTKPKGGGFVILSCCAFLYYDMLTYVLLPQWFGLRHLVFWGGNQPEPIMALTELGVDANVATFAIVSLSIFHTMLLFKCLSRHKQNNIAS
jgi:hypothetical protein